MPLIQAAEAHCEYVVYNDFAESVKGLISQVKIFQVLSELCELWGLWLLKKAGSDLLACGFWGPEMLEKLEDAFLQKLGVIRKVKKKY